jgi:hypothetical protein
MAQEKPNCERCGAAKPARTYKPNLGKHPKKTVLLCDECAAKDKDLIPVDNPLGHDKPIAETAASQSGDANVIETVDFGPAAPPEPELPPVTADGPPVDRKTIVGQIEERKKTVQKARAEIAKLKQQIARIQQEINTLTNKHDVVKQALGLLQQLSDNRRALTQINVINDNNNGAIAQLTALIQ